MFLKKDKNVWRYYQNLNNMIYISWDKWKKQTLVMLGHFLCPFTPLKTQIIQFWKNEKKLPEISSFYTCTKNHIHMMYGSRDMEWYRQNFFSFWAFFCPFTPLMILKIKILKKWKKCLEIWSFHTYMCTINEDMIYVSWNIRHNRQNFLSFRVIFGHFTPLTTQTNQNCVKLKKHLEILSF